MHIHALTAAKNHRLKFESYNNSEYCTCAHCNTKSNASKTNLSSPLKCICFSGGGGDFVPHRHEKVFLKYKNYYKIYKTSIILPLTFKSDVTSLNNQPVKVLMLLTLSNRASWHLFIPLFILKQL